jgi:hypothetical protein
MSVTPTRSRSLLFLPAVLLAVLLTSSRPVDAQAIPTPEAYLGFPVGADGRLAHWDQILGYLQTVDGASDRVTVQVLGATTQQREFPVVIVTSEANMRDLERIKGISRRLYDPASVTSEAEARRLIDEGKTVVCMTLNIHSTEIGSSQMVLELIHRLATEDSPYVRNILDNTVALIFPSLNPDGQAMVVDWHNQTAGTEFQGARMPWLYHPYAGHDNNRDAYMGALVETRHLNRVLYHDWFPLIWLDEHQMGNRGARLFVMPAAGPPNPNVDPWIYRTAGLLGFHQGQALDQAGKTGVVYGQTYTYWWQGAMAWTGWWHNMVGMLTEMASANLAFPVESPPHQAPATPEYLVPWPGGTWRLRDIVDYELIFTMATLDAAADMRENLLEGIWAVNQRTVAKGAEGGPFAVIVPADQHDRPTVTKFLQVMRLGGAHIERAEAPFTAGGISYPAGTFVIPMAQVFRNWIKDILEPQVYPSDVRPYDVTGWSLGMQMGVETVFVDEPFSWRGAPLEEVSVAPGRVIGRGNSFVLDGRQNAAFTAALRLLRDGAAVGRVDAPVTIGEVTLPAGSFTVSGSGARAKVEALAAELGVDAYAANVRSARRLQRTPRVALYQEWGSNMDEGWTRLVLDDFGWDPITIHPEDVRDQRDLHSKYDVIVFASSRLPSIINGAGGRNTPEQYQGGIAESGLQALQAFARSGGTIVTLGSANQLLLEHFAAPFTAFTAGRGSEFQCPGSILEIQVDPTHPLAWGMPAVTDLMYSSDMLLDPAPVFGDPGATVAMMFGDSDPLKSGWIQSPETIFGKIGAASLPYGEGTLVLLPLQVQRRAQTHATFKLLFNPLMNSVAR